MRLVTATEMQAIDRHAIEQIGIPSLVLMENAGLKALLTLERALSGLGGKRFTIVCGRGNNGGDGLVMARHLFNHQIEVNTFIVGSPSELSPDATANLKILLNSNYQPIFMTQTEDLDHLRVALEFSDIAVDAIYGTGFSGHIEGYPREVVRIFNASRSKKISIDVPSGLCSNTGRLSNPSVIADLTVTLGLPKLGLYLHPGCETVGEIWVADIGLPQVSCDTIPGSVSLLTPRLASLLLPSRSNHAHKGSFGHLLILAGSAAYQGAGVLTSYGALRSGTGLVTLGLPAGLSEKMNVDVLPETILRACPSRDGGFAFGEAEVREFAGLYRAIVAGPGWGRSPDRRRSLQALINGWAGALLLDADALNAIEDTAQLANHCGDLVLTPHLGEMSRLTGKTVSAIRDDLLGTATEFTQRTKCVLVLKGSITVIMDPSGQTFLCARPNSGLARGGSGDLLSGLIGGMLAQGISAFAAAALGVHLHAEAAEIARSELGADAMTVSEIASFLPRAFRRLRGEDDTRTSGSA
ncbi:MAG: NAD(P)H-hydrate dehydratase [Candidatus Riflebacteria bacterium]|nr:NAD(P)H-hydrate dehydratase [Candidatus Riflebacteria bacterium]